MAADTEDGLEDDYVGRIAELTVELLDKGIEPSKVAYALVAVAAHMGLNVCGDPSRVFAVLLGAMADQAFDKARDSEVDEDGTTAHVPVGVQVH